MVFGLITIGTTVELIDYFAAKERSKASSRDDLTVVKDHAQQIRNALEVNGIETMSQQSQEIDPRECRFSFPQSPPQPSL